MIRSSMRNPATSMLIRQGFAILLGLVCSLSFPFAVLSQPAAPTAEPPSSDDPASDDTAAETPSDDEPEPEDPEDPPLPRLEEMVLPSKEAFLTEPAVDWLVLVGDKVLEIEPVYPRPGKLEAIQAAIKNGFTDPETGARAGDDDETRLRKKAKRDALAYLDIRLLEGEDRDFRLHSRFVKEIIYFEDMLLQRVDQLLDDAQTTDVLDLLVALNQRQSNWPGTRDRLLRLMSVESRLKYEAEQFEPALVQLEQLHTLEPAYRGLSTQLAQAGDKLMSLAFEEGDFRQVRHFLGRLRARIPSQNVVPTWTETLQSRAADQLAAALKAESQADWPTATAAIRESARIWPHAPELNENFRRISFAFPSIEAGVTEFTVDREDGWGAKRLKNWLEPSIFQVDRLDGSVVRYTSSLFATWEPTPLGKSVLFRLRSGWTTNQFMETLARKIDPAANMFAEKDNQSATYDERLAHAISSIRYRSPTEFEIAFRHPPLVPEALMRFPVEAASFSQAANPADAIGSRFVLEQRTDEFAVYHRVPWSPSRSGDRPVAEIIERKYATDEKAIQGLLRGEVSLLPRVPARLIAPLQSHNEVFVNEYAIPVTHLLRFRSEHPALANKAFRLALVHSLRRERILEEVVLGEPAGRLGRVSSAPMPMASYATNTEVRPHPYDIRLAISVLVAARKELSGNIPVLKMYVPAEPILQAAAEAIIANWKRIGIEAVLTTDPSTWDIRYETVSLAEPLTDLWPCLTGSETARVQDLAPLAPWLRQSLIALDNAGDRDTAISHLKTLHQQLSADVTLLPLWEVSEFVVVRRTIKGLPQRPFEPYQNHAAWRVQPWFAKEPL